MLPAVYRFVGASFRAGPSALGELTLARALLQALASPFGGLAGLGNLLHSQTAGIGANVTAGASEAHLQGTAFVRLLPAAAAGHLFDRVWVIAVGCILWAVMAASFCTTSSVSALSLSLWASDGCRLGPDRAKRAKHHRRSGACVKHACYQSRHSKIVREGLLSARVWPEACTAGGCVLTVLGCGCRLSTSKATEAQLLACCR